MLQIDKWVLGPVSTNTYLVGDPDTRQAVVIDPAWDGKFLAEEILKAGWQIQHIWITHAHFDHFGGLADLLTALEVQKKADFFVGLHPKDKMLWKVKGGAVMFGISIKSAPTPDHSFEEGEIIPLGNTQFVVHHTPGHSAGHVVFHCPEEAILFSGDLIFKQGVGRTDLLGGSYQVLMTSINTWVLSLPDHTRIFSGHGPETTVGAERSGNPFISTSI